MAATLFTLAILRETIPGSRGGPASPVNTSRMNGMAYPAWLGVGQRFWLECLAVLFTRTLLAVAFSWCGAWRACRCAITTQHWKHWSSHDKHERRPWHFDSRLFSCHCGLASYHKAHARSDLMWYDESLFMGKRTYETYRRIKQLIVKITCMKSQSAQVYKTAPVAPLHRSGHVKLFNLRLIDTKWKWWNWRRLRWSKTDQKVSFSRG